MVGFAILSLTNVPRVKAFGYSDALLAPDLPSDLSAYYLASSPAPGFFETSEYMIGNATVGVVLPESSGAINVSTEDWSDAEESQVVDEIQTALNWWKVQNPFANVNFTLSVNYRVPTKYEPISCKGYPPSSGGEEDLWIRDTMNALGYPGADYFGQVRNYINALRNSYNTNWAFAVFVVDSSSDLDGKFSEGTYFAYAYLGGPFLVMTYDNDGWGIDDMDKVTAHEVGHIFYATDEYNGVPEYSGYLNVLDVDSSSALMDDNDWWLSTGTIGQIGWRDTDGDGIQDIADTYPDTALNPYAPDPTTNPYPTYTGNATEIPYPNNNPYGTSRDVTINRITKVEYRADGGVWNKAIPSDGAFDEAEEGFYFTAPYLSVGPHTIETYGANSVGNNETSYGSDTVTRRLGPAIGGINIPVAKLNLIAPYVGAASTLLAAIVMTAKLSKRIKREEKTR